MERCLISGRIFATKQNPFAVESKHGGARSLEEELSSVSSNFCFARSRVEQRTRAAVEKTNQCVSRRAESRDSVMRETGYPAFITVYCCAWSLTV